MSGPADPPAPPGRAAALAEAGRMLRLAGPVMAARAGLVVMLTVDTLMTGRAAGREVAYLGLGLSPLMVFMLASVGLLQGAMVLVAQANGARDYARCGAIWRVALIHAAVLGAVFMAIPFAAEPLFLAIGHSPDLARGAAGVTFQFAWGMPGLLLYIACGYFMEGIGRPRAGMAIMLAANVLNVLADGIVVLGWWGLVEPMGAAGAMMTTSAIRWGIFAAMLTVVLSQRDRAKYGIGRGAPRETGIVKGIWRIGLPVAATGGIENGAYATLAQMAGLLGAASLAAHQVTINLLTLAYMAANGMAAATSVRVGFAVGRRDRAGMSLSGWTGIALGTLLMTAIAAVFVAFPAAIGDIFLHTDAASLAIAAGTIVAAGIFMPVAGAMSVAMGALRGAGDMGTAMAAYALGFLIVGVPAAWAFAFPLGHGAAGLIFGLMTGVGAALIVLVARFRVIARREVRRL